MEALQEYTNALLHCEDQKSETMAMAYANRSAVLMAIGSNEALVSAIRSVTQYYKDCHVIVVPNNFILPILIVPEGSLKIGKKVESRSAVVWTNDSLVFFYFREMAFKVLGGDLARRLLGANSALAPRSLLPKSYPWNKIRYLY